MNTINKIEFYKPEKHDKMISNKSKIIENDSINEMNNLFGNRKSARANTMIIHEIKKTRFKDEGKK